MKLVIPSIRYKDSFIEAVKEYQKEDLNQIRYKNLNADELENNFAAYITKILSQSVGENLPKGIVPETTFWLIDKGDFIGRASIRHELTKDLLKEGGHIGYDIRPSKRNMGYGKKLLKMALKKAKKLGIKNALITCDITNISSKKVIEANGGVLKNAIEVNKGKPKKLRYWIQIN